LKNDGAVTGTFKKTNYASGNIRVVFDIPEGIAGGDFPSKIYRIMCFLYRAGTSGNYTPVTTISTAYGDIDQVAFEVANADLVNGYYTLGTTDQTNSPVAGAEGTNFLFALHQVPGMTRQPGPLIRRVSCR
jgi:hypothetical protein